MVVYFCKAADCVIQIAKAKTNGFSILFGIEMTSSCIHICTMKQISIPTCKHNTHTQGHLVEAENAISNELNHHKKAVGQGHIK